MTLGVGVIATLIGLAVSLTMLAIAVLSLFWKVSAHVTMVDIYVKELRHERFHVKKIPVLEHRLTQLEHKAGIYVIPIPITEPSND